MIRTQVGKAQWISNGCIVWGALCAHPLTVREREEEELQEESKKK
jgi:hypothetical protein